MKKRNSTRLNYALSVIFLFAMVSAASHSTSTAAPSGAAATSGKALQDNSRRASIIEQDAASSIRRGLFPGIISTLGSSTTVEMQDPNISPSEDSKSMTASTPDPDSNSTTLSTETFESDFRLLQLQETLRDIAHIRTLSPEQTAAIEDSLLRSGAIESFHRGRVRYKARIKQALREVLGEKESDELLEAQSDAAISEIRIEAEQLSTNLLRQNVVLPEQSPLLSQALQVAMQERSADLKAVEQTARDFDLLRDAGRIDENAYAFSLIGSMESKRRVMNQIADRVFQVLNGGIEPSAESAVRGYLTSDEVIAPKARSSAVGERNIA